MENLKQLQQDWQRENEPLGRKLGYPECCIKAFCDQPPALLKNRAPTQEDKMRYEAGCINGEFTGFIPCTYHAKEIIQGRMTLYSLIRNRDKQFPAFPGANGA